MCRTLSGPRTSPAPTKFSHVLKLRLHDFTYLTSHVRERVVYLERADDRALYGAPQHLFDLGVARELRRDQDVCGDHLFEHREARAVRRVRPGLHLAHDGAAHGDAAPPGFRELLF